MSHDDQIKALLAEVATAFNTRVGDPDALVTSSKVAVGAINELKGLIDSLTGGSLDLNGLDDVVITGGVTEGDVLVGNATGEMENVSGLTLFEEAGAAAAVKTELLGGATSAFDTLMELKTLIDAAEETSAIDALTSQLGGKQAAHAILTNLSNLALTAGDFIRATGANTFAVTASGAMGLTLLGAADAAAARNSLQVWSKTEIGPVDTDYVALFQAALA